MVFACQDFTLPNKFPHCLKATEISCPTAIAYKAEGRWGLSSCFIVTVFMRIFFLVSILLLEKCFLHCPEMIVRFSVDLPNCFPGKKKKSQDYIHKAERKTATFYSFIKDVGVLGLISSSAWGNLNQHHLSLRRIP